MSTLSGGPGPIVTNGLVLYFDAANPNAAPTRNLLTYTTDLTNAAWTKTRCSITASATIAPDGTNTAFAFNMSTGSIDLKRLTSPNIASSVSGGLYTFSLFVKQNNFSGSGNASAGIQLGNYNSSQTAGVEPAFNVLSNFQSTGSFSISPASSGSAVDRGAIDVGNGWYRIYTTCNWASSISSFSTFIDMDNGILTGSQYAGTGIYIWGPQFETGYLSPYQPVTGTTKPWPSIGSTITGSMVNNPTWTSGNGGSVVFDGVNDYVQLSANQNLSNNYSIHVIFKSQTTGSSSDYFRLLNGLTSAPQSSMRLEWADRFLAYNNSASLQAYAFNYPLVPSFNLSQLYNDMHITVDNSNILTIYNNGRVCTPTCIITGSIDFQLIGRAQGGFLPETISVFQLYNRTLTASEVLQNYNSLKSRFGLT